jgi:hypothetical protein
MELPCALCAKSLRGSVGSCGRCAIIFSSVHPRFMYLSTQNEGERSTSMRAADRLSLSRPALLFLFVILGIPRAARSAALEESAKDFARQVAAALPARENVNCEVRNASSLKSADVARIEQAFNAELQAQGVGSSTSGSERIGVVVTLSENWKGLVWTGTIRQGDSSRTVLMAVPRSIENRPSSNALPVTIRGERFWEGPEHILDAGEVAGIGGKPWLVLLLWDRLLIQEPDGRLEIPFAPAMTRDSWGKLNPGQAGNAIAFSIPSRDCTADLDTRRVTECFPADAPGAGASPSRVSSMTDLSPSSPAPPGKGIELAMGSICGSTSEFLASGSGDDTQADSVQAFEMQPAGPVAVSAELGFPGPVVALHSALAAPRAVVRNLSTGNYEAYRLSITCAQ